jgi:hypothetical protein
LRLRSLFVAALLVPRIDILAAEPVQAQAASSGPVNFPEEAVQSMRARMQLREEELKSSASGWDELWVLSYSTQNRGGSNWYTARLGDKAMTAALAGMKLSNHSYSHRYGWHLSSGEWFWLGSDTPSSEDARFGKYQRQSREIDAIAWENPNYLSVWSSGNERAEDCATGSSGLSTFNHGVSCPGILMRLPIRRLTPSRSRWEHNVSITASGR